MGGYLGYKYDRGNSEFKSFDKVIKKYVIMGEKHINVKNSSILLVCRNEVDTYLSEILSVFSFFNFEMHVLMHAMISFMKIKTPFEYLIVDRNPFYLANVN